MKDKIILFLKGVLMGICDIIPGISGGTIAFITGIYQRLINAVKSFSPELVADVFRYLKNRKNLDKLKEDIKKLDLIFLIVLGVGIGTAFLIGSRIIKFLLDEYFAFTISFFIGLILASSKLIFDKIEKHDMKNITFGFIGMALGLMLVFIIPANITPNLIYVFFGGFLAISAMFLPGISGAFILLILGLYEFMISVLHDIAGKISYFIVFTIGAGLGAFTISRIVSFLFRKDRCKTLYFLLGLVLGSLSIPVKKIFLTASFNGLNVVIMVVLVLLGIISVLSIGRFENE